MASLIGGLRRTNYCAHTGEEQIGKSIVLMGWVQRARNLGGLIFLWLRDRTGVVQVVFDADVCGAEQFALAETLRSEFVIAVEGEVRARTADAVNEKLATGRVEVFAQTLRILNKAETPPIYIDDDHPDESEAVRLKYRYLDLRRVSNQQTLMLRSRVTNVIRRTMEGKGFIEVETPILTKSTPEGARDYLVPSRVHDGDFYALPQSPQIYKQLLMVGGIDRYFQIARCFRDEDSRADRQPEFTQLDLEMSFVEEGDVQGVVEGVFKTVFGEVMDIALPETLPRVTWHEVMEDYGSDKPDRRFGLKIKDLSAETAGCGFSAFESVLGAGGTVRGINAAGCADRLSRKEIDALTEFIKGCGAKGLVWAKVSAEGVTSPILKFVGDENMAKLLDRLEAKAGDVVFIVADKKSVALQALGHLRMELGRKLNLIDKTQWDLFWVTEFPLMEKNDDGTFSAMHHPFTSPMDEDIPLLDTDLQQVRAKAYDLVLNGIEMGSGSIRIHLSEIQRRMFSLISLSDEEANLRFGFLLDAFKFGTPPHGGFAFGIDRLIMQLAGKDSLRDVIAFPKAQNASCLMMNTPSSVRDEQLAALNIRHIGGDAGAE